MHVVSTSRSSGLGACIANAAWGEWLLKRTCTHIRAYQDMCVPWPTWRLQHCSWNIGINFFFWWCFWSQILSVEKRTLHSAHNQATEKPTKVLFKVSHKCYWYVHIWWSTSIDCVLMLMYNKTDTNLTMCVQHYFTVWERVHNSYVTLHSAVRNCTCTYLCSSKCFLPAMSKYWSMNSHWDWVNRTGR